MSAPKCPFQTPIIAREFGCSQAQSVSVRNTPQIHCRSESGLAVCSVLYERLKQAGLQAFDLPDDLTRTPHNVYLKIQHAGLHGLQRRAAAAATTDAGLDDLYALVQAVTAGGTRLDQQPYRELAAEMPGFRLKRRRERRR